MEIISRSIWGCIRWSRGGPIFGVKRGTPASYKEAHINAKSYLINTSQSSQVI